MIETLRAMPIGWFIVVIFTATFMAAGGVYWLIMSLAAGERAKAFKAVSPAMLPPLGIIFGLFVAFIAAQVWGDLDRAHTAVNREASALRAIVLLSAGVPTEAAAKLRGLVQQQIEDAVTQEWPEMARGRETLRIAPHALTEALRLSLALAPADNGQTVAQREIVAAIQGAFDARRQRIIASQSHVNWIKWSGLLIEGLCMLVAIAMVHCDNRRGAALAMGLFATGIAVSVILIASHTGPFSGHVSVSPDVLRQVMPE